MPAVTPDILCWARERAGFALDEAAKKVGVSPDVLEALEKGMKDPTDRQLEKFSRLYGCPLVAFFLTHPPKESVKAKDFRTKSSFTSTLLEEGCLRRLLSDVEARQSLVRELREEEEEGKPAPVAFVGSLAGSSNPGAVEIAATLQKALDFDIAVFRSQSGRSEAFKYLREKTQKAGIFVLLVGDCGSYQSAISPDIFRGVSLSDPVAPFVVINNNDAKAAWSFTLLHELAHLALGRSVISGGLEYQLPQRKIERLCDEAAALVLLPMDDRVLLFQQARGAKDNLLETVRDLARKRNLSQTMIVCQLLKEKIISFKEYQQLTKTIRDSWLAHKVREKAARDGKKGGPSAYVIGKFRLGDYLLDLTRRGLATGVLVPTQAARILGINNPAAVGRFLQ